MNQQQLHEFNTFGCVSRSLILFAAAKGHPISADDFCNQFAALFPQGHCGYLVVSQITDVVRGLKIGSGFDVSRRYAEIMDQVNNKGRGVLVESEINLNPGATDVVRHCSYLSHINAAGFALMSPATDGNSYQLNFQAADWDTKLCTGLAVL